METLTKFGGQMDGDKLKALREHAKESGQKFSSILNEMAEAYLRSKRVRPEVMKNAQKLIRENRELLERLSK